MARIKTYVVDNIISDQDKIIGTDADNSSETKNFRVGDLRSYMLSGLEPETGGNLKITTITETSETYLTPESWINNQDPAIDVLQYEIIFLILNGRTYIFRKNNAIYGVGETQAISSDFTEIDITSVINASLQNLNSVLNEGDTSELDANIGSLGLFDTFDETGYGKIYCFKNRIYFQDTDSNDLFYIEEKSIVIKDTETPYTTSIGQQSGLTENVTATLQNTSGIIAYIDDIPTDYITNISTSSDELEVVNTEGNVTVNYTQKTMPYVVASNLFDSVTNTIYFIDGGEFNYSPSSYPIDSIAFKFNTDINLLASGSDKVIRAYFLYENGTSLIKNITADDVSVVAGSTLSTKIIFSDFWSETPGERLSVFEATIFPNTVESTDLVSFNGCIPTSLSRYIYKF